MITAELLRQLWKSIATAYISRIAFASEWQVILDANSDQSYPACIWEVYGPATITPNGGGLSSSHTITLAFLDTHDQDRTPETRDMVVSRMGVVATHCFEKFYREYVWRDDNTFGGVDVSFTLKKDPVLTSIYDIGPMHVSGVQMQFTIAYDLNMECAETMFAP